MEAKAKHPGGRPRKEIDMAGLKRLLEEGRSLRQIAKDLGRGFGTVHRAAKALGTVEMIQNSLRWSKTPLREF